MRQSKASSLFGTPEDPYVLTLQFKSIDSRLSLSYELVRSSGHQFVQLNDCEASISHSLGSVISGGIQVLLIPSWHP